MQTDKSVSAPKKMKKPARALAAPLGEIGNRVDRPTHELVPTPANLDEVTFAFLDSYTDRTPAPDPAHMEAMNAAMASFRRVHRLPG